MDLIFQGFQSSLPLWVFILIFIGTTLLAWWSYRSVTGIKTIYRYALIGLRSAAFLVLLVLLVNPFFKTESPYFEDSRIMVMLDNSASTAIRKSNYRGSESYRNVLGKLRFQDSSSVNFDFYGIGSQTQPIALDSLAMDADQTDLSTAIQTIKNNQSDATAAILLSDGIYTKGQNPVFEAQNLTLPVFTIGLGDTTFQKDILVSSVSTNSTGYVNSEQPVTVTVSSKGFNGESFNVELRKEGSMLHSQTVTPKLDRSSQEVTFNLKLDEEGLQQYQVVIPALAEEWTKANNSQFFSIDVEDAKQQILSLAFEVHPDVKFIRSLLLQDQNTRLTRRTWLRGNQFIEGDFSFSADTLDLMVLHGYPPSGLSATIRNRIAELAKNVPLVIVATPMFSPQSFEQSIQSLPVTLLGEWDFLQVSLNPALESTAHPVMELPPLNFDSAPTLLAPIRNLDHAPGSTTLFSSIYQGDNTETPVVTTQELGNRRISFISGFGWYRLVQANNSEVREFVRQLWLNIISWTVTDPGNELLEVRPAQTSFTGSEAVVINAYLNNERGEVESDAAIDISISSDSVDSRYYSMERRGAGQYRLDVGTLPEGLYSYEATAKKENRTIDSEKGEFAVARSNSEFLNTNRNDRLLKQIAERSGGEYVPFDSVDGLWNRLNQQGLLDRNEKIETTFFYPHQSLIWFLIVLGLLVSEWIFRKYLSLP